ncbi:MAG: carbamoyl-phosphate synthase large subunit, partial [Mycobacteriaceae bacterium]
FGTAFAKSQEAATGSLPTNGRVFVSVANRDKRTMILPIQRLASLGFELVATEGTAAMLRRNGLECVTVSKQTQIENGTASAEHRSIVDLINDGEIDFILNTPASTAAARGDGYDIRAAAVRQGVSCVTTVQGAVAAVQAIEALKGSTTVVRAIQDVEHDH